jgi:site-specific DNA recombinase
MNAAIYCRKSDKQDDQDGDVKSIGRQETGARAFIATKTWTLDDSEIGRKPVKGPNGKLLKDADGRPVTIPILRHVYVDDGVSGYSNSQSDVFQRMMRDAEAGAFQHLVFFDIDRFGRNARWMMADLHRLDDFRVRAWDSATGEPVDLDSFEGRITATLKAEFAQQFRDQIRKHTKRAMHTKAEQGYVTGGKTFGYTNEGPKGQKRWVIYEPEAAVVRRINEMCADGYGAREIAKTLNHAKVPQPRAQQGRADGWSVSTVRAILDRKKYRGLNEYGKTMKAYGPELRDVFPDDPERLSAQIPNPNGPKRYEAEELRIIDPELAARVDERLAGRRRRYLAAVAKGKKTAERAHGRYLLSGGMLICPDCGASFEGRKYPWKPSKKTAALLADPAAMAHAGHVYICSTRRRKPGVCSNTLALDIAATDETVLSMVAGELLSTRYINELLACVDRGDVDHSVRLLAERERLSGEVANLVNSIASGVPADTIAPAIKEREAEIAKLDVQLRRPRREPPNIERLRAALEQRAAEWKDTLRAEPDIARLLLRRLIGPLVLFDTAPDFCRFETTPTTELLDGLAPTSGGTSPTGFEPVFWP